MELRRSPRRYREGTLRLARLVEAVAARLGGRRRYARRLGPGRLRVRREEVRLPGLPRALDGFVVLHLSDLHAGPFLDAGSLRHAIDVATAAAPDLLALTGDYLTHRTEEAVSLAPAFAELRTRYGGFLVFGNHDYRDRREGEIATAFAEHGVRALRNEGCPVAVGDARLWVAGIEDVEEGKVVDLDAALRGRRPDDVTILLAHHPGTAARLEGRGVDLVLSGHTHGGQIVVGGRSLIGSLRSPYRQGLHDVAGTRLFVTAGLGVLGLPLRIGAPPEIALLTLRE